MEVVGIDGHLVVDGSQLVGLADGVGDERRVVDPLGHVALVAREDEQVVEVEITGFEHAHHLNALGRFAVEGDGGGADDLADEPLESDAVDGQVAAADELAHAIEQGVGPVERLVGQRVVFGSLSVARFPAGGDSPDGS